MLQGGRCTKCILFRKSAPSALLLQARMLQELPSVAGHAGEMVRGAAAQLAVLAPTMALEIGDAAGGCSPV